MPEWLIVTSLGVIGASMGSFAGAMVWRLRAKQLADDDTQGQMVDKKELKRLTPLLKNDILHDRSIDLDTGRQLRWFELLPIVSWVFLRGRSRYSGKPIGLSEFLIELGLAAYFIMMYYTLLGGSAASGSSIIVLLIWLVAGVIMAIQFVTDLKWQILWTMLSLALIALGVATSTIMVLGSDNTMAALWSAVGSVMILGGLYYVLYFVSHEKWVGLGDVFLAVGLGLLLADWQLALLALFLANFMGAVIAIGGMLIGKIKRHQTLPFGPFLILGAIIAKVFGANIINLYLGGFLPL